MKKLIIIAGPCLAESYSLLDETAGVLSGCIDSNVDFYFKASYRKANRTSINSVSGYGDEKALKWIADISEKYKVKTLTDVHTAQEAEIAAKYVDCIQIPAFLSRQTDILVAAGNTGKAVNIKKGQFMAPEDVTKAADKVLSTGNKNIFLTERGTSFGYHDLVVDFRGFKIMEKSGFPVIFDATHSVQRPSVGEQSGGQPEYIDLLTKAALGAGASGVFFETHPEPTKALSDAATQLPLNNAPAFIEKIVKINNFFNTLNVS